jgi:trehalose-phosphatase
MSAADVRLAADTILGRSAGRHLLVLADFDGTLCEFDPDPQAVWLPDGPRTALEQLGGAGATIALVTGRRLEDVRARAALGVPAYYAGLHGLEIDGPDERYEHPGTARAQGVLHTLAAAIARDLADVPGAFVEDKGLAVVAHYRAASDEDGAAVEARVLRHARPLLDAGELRTMHGACALELLPNIDWDKGRAVDWIRERVARAHADVWPLYIGDDVTDEDGFRAVESIGLSIAASSRATGADLAVDGPAEVEALLRQIAPPQRA